MEPTEIDEGYEVVGLWDHLYDNLEEAHEWALVYGDGDGEPDFFKGGQA